jgi:hypothetical protein
VSYDIIQSIKNSLSTIQTGLDEDTKAVAGSGGSNKRISIKGGVFRKFANGKEVGSIEDRHMEVIFVKMSHDPARTYYAQGYKEGEKVAPICWSSNSKKPDAEVKNPQADACDKCQFSVKGSGQNGTGTACRISWRTAVVLPQDPGGDVMQLVLPATSCFGKEENGKHPFRPYIQYLASHNISAGRVVTRMQFDTKSATPKLLFSPVGAVDPSDMDVILSQGKSAAAESAVKLTVFQQDEGDAPAQPEVPASEPTLRESTPEVAPANDVSEVMKKWAKKK